MPVVSKPNHFLIALIVIFLILAGILLERLDLPITQSTASVREYIVSFGFFAPLVYIFLMTLAIIIVPVPDFVIGLAAGILFPWYLATLYTLIADFLGSSIVFFLARRFGRPFVAGIVREEELVKLDHIAARLGGKTIFFLRLIPGFNFDLVGYLAGLTPIDYKIFILATMFGVLPRRLGTYLIVDKGVLVDPSLLFIGVLLSMVLAPVGIYWWWRRK